MDKMSIAAAYNRFTGAGITHHDLDDWGIIEVEWIRDTMDLYHILSTEAPRTPKTRRRR